MPVLLPGDEELLAAAQLVVRPAFSALSMRRGGADGVTVSLSATAVTHRYEGVRGATQDRAIRDGKPAWVLQNEGIWSVAWEESGASYVLELECAKPGEDSRCASDAEIVRLAESLRFAGGSFAPAASTVVEGGGR